MTSEPINIFASSDSSNRDDLWAINSNKKELSYQTTLPLRTRHTSSSSSASPPSSHPLTKSQHNNLLEFLYQGPPPGNLE